MNIFDTCVIIHGCPLNAESAVPKEKRWMNWLEKKLQEEGYNAKAPDMPQAWEPKYEDWKKIIETYPITHNSLLVGHSCGAAFLVRYLLDTKKKVKKLILVAPAKIPENENDKRKELYNFELPADASRIADKIVIFTSNDFSHHLKSLEIYKEALHPKVIHLENKGHFLIYTMGTNEFPELLQEIVS